jgi:hypothetical protein
MYVRTAIGIWPQPARVGWSSAALLSSLWGQRRRQRRSSRAARPGTRTQAFRVRAGLASERRSWRWQTRGAQRSCRGLGGVGGAGLGPNGGDQWLQVGLSAFHGTGGNSTRSQQAGRAQYHEIDSTVASGERQRVASSSSQRPNWWRVWVNDKPVSNRSTLPAAAGYQPIATAGRGTAARPSATASHTGSPASQSLRHVVRLAPLRAGTSLRGRAIQ